MNPPSVLTVDRPAPEEVVLALALPRDHPAFAGHFSGRPILPGVVQIDWAVRLGQTYLNTDTPVASDFQVKFHRVFEPDPKRDLSLKLRIDRPKASLSFEYRSGPETISSGRVKLASKP